MPSVRIDKTLADQPYFITLTVKDWHYLFDRHDRFRLLSDALTFAQEKKDLRIYAYVFMLNHIHFVGRAKDMIAVVRDFKRFTTNALLANIRAFEPAIESLFRGEDGKCNIWQSGNMSKQIMTEAYLQQKVDYIHNNPVRKQYVNEPQHWLHSSANPHSPVRVDAWDFY